MPSRDRRAVAVIGLSVARQSPKFVAPSHLTLDAGGLPSGAERWA